MLRIGRHNVIPAGIMDVRVRAPASAAVAGWWEVAGKTCVAAYQPKGAASLAASYVNLAQPGVNDAAPGNAPTFATATGWTFVAANSQYLTTGIVQPGSTSWSTFVRFSGSDGVLVGARNDYYLQSFHLRITSSGNRSDVRLGNTATSFAYMSSGVWGYAGTAEYLNGLSRGTVVQGPVPTGIAMTIGAENGVTGMFLYFNGTVAAVAVYSDALTAGEAGTLSTAMAEL